MPSFRDTLCASLMICLLAGHFPWPNLDSFSVQTFVQGWTYISFIGLIMAPSSSPGDGLSSDAKQWAPSFSIMVGLGVFLLSYCTGFIFAIPLGFAFTVGGIAQNVEDVVVHASTDSSSTITTASSEQKNK